MDISRIARQIVPPAGAAVPSDIAISQSVEPHPIAKVMAACGFAEDEYQVFGKYKAKIDLKVQSRLCNQPVGNYVVVTGITPTSLGEGKSTTTIGLSQALGAHLGRNVFTVIRQPSMGPIWGTKGGAAGGGYSQACPMEDFNLGLPDINSVAAANNLLAAAIDTRMFHESTQTDEQLLGRLCPAGECCEILRKRLRKQGVSDDTPLAALSPEQIRRFVRLDVDPATLSVQRVVDINDRMLRKVTVGQGKDEKNFNRQTGFDIAVASEVMSILALSTSLMDMRRRIGEMVVALSKGGEPVTAEDVGCAGAMTVLMREAIMPNVMQTVEGTPCAVHAGPFASISFGNSSVIADDIALRVVGENGFVVTEAGFGADIGLEKFFDIKCRASGLKPQCIVLVATVRALKNHGGVAVAETKMENVEAVRVGCANLRRHVQNSLKFNVPIVVCINQFTNDTAAEIEVVRQAAMEAGATAAVLSNHWAMGGKGAVQLSSAVISACESAAATRSQPTTYLYPLEMSIRDKITKIAVDIYRADGVDFTDEASRKIDAFERIGLSRLPVCMAKTAMSFSGDPNLRNAPTGFRITVRDARASVGAGFIYPLIGEISTMPGLTTRPAYYDVDIDQDGKVHGLF